ncbi:BPSL0761 family protein [Pseudomonas aeruginosa]
MTLPHERTRSVVKTEAFLRDLSRNTELPDDIRSYAKSLLRHYPADSTPFGHSAHADPDTCSTLIRTGSRSAATQGWHC